MLDLLQNDLNYIPVFFFITEPQRRRGIIIFIIKFSVALCQCVDKYLFVIRYSLSKEYVSKPTSFPSPPIREGRSKQEKGFKTFSFK